MAPIVLLVFLKRHEHRLTWEFNSTYYDSTNKELDLEDTTIRLFYNKVGVPQVESFPSLLFSLFSYMSYIFLISFI